VPAPHAQPVVDEVVTAGIKAILNFSPGALKVPSDVKLKSVDLTVSLESLSFFLAERQRLARDAKPASAARAGAGTRP
jgi:redox-sensing transcriptional repressor